MLKVILLVLSLLFYSCNKTSYLPKNKNHKSDTVKSDSFHNFIPITFPSTLKNIYGKLKTVSPKSEIGFSEIYKKIKNKIVIINFYINFENFSSIPEIYKENLKDNNNIFHIIGIYIDNNYILSDLSLLKEAETIYISRNNILEFLTLVGYDELIISHY